MTQNIELQKTALLALQNYLQGFQEDLLAQVERYGRIVEGLRQEGLSDEVYHYYHDNFFNRDKSYIQSLLEHIRETDAPYITKNLEATGMSKETATTGWDF